MRPNIKPGSQARALVLGSLLNLAETSDPMARFVDTYEYHLGFLLSDVLTELDMAQSSSFFFPSQRTQLWMYWVCAVARNVPLLSAEDDGQNGAHRRSLILFFIETREDAFKPILIKALLTMDKMAGPEDNLLRMFEDLIETCGFPQRPFNQPK